MGMFDLTDKAVEYNGKLVRANAVADGDIILVDDTKYGVVLKVEKFGFDLAENDEATQEIVAEVKARGEEDKISPHFDETVAITVALAGFSEDGKVHLSKESRYFPEWGFVRVYV